MIYTIQQLAQMANVSVRTLHHYDAIGLLSPNRNHKNGYRAYNETDLLVLQQILFFRELEIPLNEIKHLLSQDHFDLIQSLADHRELLLLKRARIDRLLKTIDQTTTHMTNQTPMNDTDLYDGFSQDEIEAYTREAKERWGNTDAYKQSQTRVQQMGKDGLQRVMKEGEEITQAIGACLRAQEKPDGEKVQQLITRHYAWLRHFYEPSPELYRGLATMYVEDPRFRDFYERVEPGLASFMKAAMEAYVWQKKEMGE